MFHRHPSTSARSPKPRAMPLAVLCLALLAAASATAGEGVFTVEHAAKLRAVDEIAISPSGELVAYVLTVPRDPYAEGDGPAWAELHVVGPPGGGQTEQQEKGRSRAFVAGEVKVSDVAWTPDGTAISFLAKRDDDEDAKKALWVIPVAGGEAYRMVAHDEDVEGYSWSPDGKQVAFLGARKDDGSKDKLEKKGFKAKVYEEEPEFVRAWIATIGEDGTAGDARMLELEGSASMLRWGPGGLGLALAPTPRIDDEYMKRKIHVVDPESGEVQATIDNPGKLEDFVWSPGGERLAVLSAADLNDPSAGRMTVAPAAGGSLTDLIPGYEGDVTSVAFADDDTLFYVAHEGVETIFARIGADGTGQQTLVPPGGPALGELSLSKDGSKVAFLADSPEHPAEVFFSGPEEGAPERWTDSNPWLADLELARQEVVSYEARDGLAIEGLLIHPVKRNPGERHPLILVVHGGPESHYSNGWLTRYSNPGQFAAAQGYAVFYPNYRGSTGRGVAFSKLHQADYAGGEFNDLVDGVKHLVATGLVDRDKVGVTGGSYGGFASAWCATALTEHFAASVMFVGISDQISKFGTTDIPNEMFEVHARRWPWDYWDWFRERSPVYHTPKARTPILIMHGEDDTRVHPSQSMELYRYLKTLGKVPVRLVFYPGEGHGNRKAAARLDYSMRLMRWMDHYLKGPGGKPPSPELNHDPEKLGVDGGGEGEED